MGLLASVLTVVLMLTGGVVAAHAADGVLPLDQYTSEKGRQLAAAHSAALGRLDAELYHCTPWLEVQKHSVGFFKPKHAAGDERYLSVRIFVEQDPSPQFAALRAHDRASAMFSRYVGPLLRRMTRDPGARNDARIDGFAVLLDWLKQTPREAGNRPVHETIAAFIDRAPAMAYLSGAARVKDLAARATVFAFDGETSLGQTRLTAWDDDFVSTYKVKNYELAPGVICD
jgi:hypothetical protein